MTKTDDASGEIIYGADRKWILILVFSCPAWLCTPLHTPTHTETPCLLTVPTVLKAQLKYTQKYSDVNSRQAVSSPQQRKGFSFLVSPFGLCPTWRRRMEKGVKQKPRGRFWIHVWSLGMALSPKQQRTLSSDCTGLGVVDGGLR